MYVVFMKVLVILLMVGAGFLVQKLHIIPKGADKHIVDLLMGLLVPCLVLNSITDCEISAKTKDDLLQISIGAFLWFPFAMLLAHFIVKALRYEPKVDRGIMAAIFTAINTGFVGYPVVRSVLGEYPFLLLVIADVLGLFYIFVLSPMQMMSGSTKPDIKGLIKSFINPTIVAMIVGLALFLAGIKLPSALEDFTATVGNSSIPLSMIVTGIMVADSKAGQLLRNTKLLVLCLLKMLLLPAVTFLAVNWLPLSASVKIVLILCAAFPTAVLPGTIAVKNGNNAQLYAEGVGLTTALCLVTLPLWITLLTQFFEL